MVLWIFVIYDTRIFFYVIHLILLWANEPIQGLACHIEASVFSELRCYSYGRESLVVINSLNFSEPLRDKTCFIDGNISIHISFLLKDPFALNGSCTVWQINQVPTLIFIHGL